jgi:hypothetical protein
MMLSYMMQMLMLVLLTVLDCIKGKFTYVHNDLDSIEKNLQRATASRGNRRRSLWFLRGVLNAWKARKIERNCSS